MSDKAGETVEEMKARVERGLREKEEKMNEIARVMLEEKAKAKEEKKGKDGGRRRRNTKRRRSCRSRRKSRRS